MQAKDVAQAEPLWTAEPFIVTHTGKLFSYRDFTEKDIDIRDIAHALCNLCRYTGHTSQFYSVAQHSMLVADKMPGTRNEKLAALLHDAAEAYTNDLAYLEHNGDKTYLQLQHRITAAIYRKFGIESVPESLRSYDLAACVFEAEGLLHLTADQLKEYRFPVHLRNLWTPWEPDVWADHLSGVPGLVEDNFLYKFDELMEE